MSIKNLSIIILVLALFGAFLLLGFQGQESLSKQNALATELDGNNTSKVKRGEALSISAIRSQLEDKLQGIEIKDIQQSPIEGFYQVFFSGEVLYVTDDGKFLFTGSLLELANKAPINHTEKAMAAFEAKQAPMRKSVIDAIPESEMVVFKAPNEKHVLTVFTDVDCRYCRKLHEEIPTLKSQGVTVRYMAYPRAGVGSSAYDKLVSVWCAEDKLAAMDDAKLRSKFSGKTCDNPVAEQYQLTRKFNISGTPALLLEDGEMIVGLPPIENLIEHLNQKSKAKQGAKVSQR